MSLLSDAEFAAIRGDLEILLNHRCTVTPMTAGVEDPEGNVPQVPGTPVTNVPCLYSTVTRVIRDEGGVTTVNVPTLMVSATLSIAAGSQVSAITDQLGTVLQAGPLKVERILDDTAGLGAPLLPTWELRAGKVSP